MSAFKAVEGLPKLHVTPLASVTCNAPKILVEVDAEDETRIKLIFEPYQAIRMITSDCFDIPGDMQIIPQTIMEIQNSSWIDELQNTLWMTDCEADFIEKSKHFLLPLQDDFLEIVAWSVRVDEC